MERSWNGRNVDLALLAVRIACFFTDRDFEVIKGKTENGHEILAQDSPQFKLLGYVDVAIEGNSQDFMIKLNLCKEGKMNALSSFRLLSMFGGGYFVLQKLKSNEAWIDLTKEFWKCTENAVLHLTNSMKT